VRDFANYIAANAINLITYGERLRAGERISSCLAESAVNAVIGKRLVKRQQMVWRKRATHLSLLIRTRACDGSFRQTFERCTRLSPTTTPTPFTPRQHDLQPFPCFLGTIECAQHRSAQPLRLVDKGGVVYLTTDAMASA